MVDSHLLWLFVFSIFFFFVHNCLDIGLFVSCRKWGHRLIVQEGWESFVFGIVLVLVHFKIVKVVLSALVFFLEFILFSQRIVFLLMFKVESFILFKLLLHFEICQVWMLLVHFFFLLLLNLLSLRCLFLQYILLYILVFFHQPSSFIRSCAPLIYKPLILFLLDLVFQLIPIGFFLEFPCFFLSLLINERLFLDWSISLHLFELVHDEWLSLTV